MDNSWKEKKNILAGLIKQVSDENGGDEIEWLRGYAKELIFFYSDDLIGAIKCFQSLVKKNIVI